MKKVFQILLFFALVLSFTNCTITKRSYRSGYHVSWKKSNKTGKETSDIKEKESFAEIKETDQNEIEFKNTTEKEVIDEKRQETDQKPSISSPKQEKTSKKKEKTNNSNVRLEAFKKILPLEQTESLDDEEPKEDRQEMDAIDVLMFILGVIAYVMLAVPLFLIGLLFYLILAEGIGSSAGVGGVAAEWYGLLAAGVIYIFGSWVLLLIFFPKRNVTEEEKRDRVFKKAVIAVILGLIATLILFLLIIL